MNALGRSCCFWLSAPVLGALFLWAIQGLPAFGDYQGPYGDVLNAVGVGERHTTDIPTAINFDYRGFDTMGEEYILFASVAGVALLLRRAEQPPALRDTKASEGVRWVTPALLATTLVFGVYVVLHGAISPGGGFQGGVVLATALILVYFATGYRQFMGLAPAHRWEAIDALGAGSYAMIGLAMLCAGGKFLENLLPLGTAGKLLSAGTVPLISIAVGCEVMAGFVVLFVEFLKALHDVPEEQS